MSWGENPNAGKTVVSSRNLLKVVVAIKNKTKQKSRTRQIQNPKLEPGITI